MAWFWLLLAGLLEVVWAYSLKLSDGFTRGLPAGVTVLAMLASFACLSVSMKALPLGTAYAIWTGIGALGAFGLGVVALGEPLGIARAVAAGLVVAGVVLLKFSG
ncbi:MAG TPA: multidrug efflux SMR transporter [Polyangiaceae bacterium]|nr:multidrug efflux SMR transporter [Polyangiaceae bacterium]